MNEKKKGPRREQWPHWAWALSATAIAITFIILVDWLSAALLYLIFNTGRPEHLLLESSQIHMFANEGLVFFMSANAFIFSVVVIGLYLIFWLGRSSRRMEAESTPDSKSARPVNLSEKFYLFLLLVGFAIAVGWASAGLELLLIGDIGSIQQFPLSFKIGAGVMYIIAAELLLFTLWSHDGRPGWRRVLATTLGLFILLSFLCALVVYDFNWGIRVRLALALGIVALLWGYVLFERVRYHAIPTNQSPKFPDPPSQKHLILTVSTPAQDHFDSEKNRTANEFALELKNAFKKAHETDLPKGILAAFEKWRQKCIDPDAAVIPPAFSTWLADFLPALQKKIESKPPWIAPMDRTELKEIFSGIPSKSTINEDEPRPGISGHLLSILMISTILKQRAENCPPVLLGDLIQEYECLRNTRFNWLMPILSVEYNLGVGDSKGLRGKKLQEMTCIFSRSTEEFLGSVEFARQFAWVMEVLFRQHYQFSESKPKFSYYDPDGNGRKLPRLETLLPPRADKAMGVDFGDYDDLSNSVLAITRKRSQYSSGDIAVDFTGGQKTTTMAVVLATTGSDTHCQYIDTNSFDMYGFDLRYRDIQALLS